MSVSSEAYKSEEPVCYQGDPSCWISLKAIEEYASRAVKAGRNIWNGRSIIQGQYGKLPVEWLADDKKYITDSQKECGINFHIICSCVEGRISAFGVTDSLSIPYATPAMKKTAIEWQLQPADKHLIRRIVVYPVFIADYRQFESMPKRIAEVFTVLEEAMVKDNVIKTIDIIRDNAKLPNRSRKTDPSRFSHNHDNSQDYS